MKKALCWFFISLIFDFILCALVWVHPQRSVAFILCLLLVQVDVEALARRIRRLL